MRCTDWWAQRRWRGARRRGRRNRGRAESVVVVAIGHESARRILKAMVVLVLSPRCLLSLPAFSRPHFSATRCGRHFCTTHFVRTRRGAGDEVSNAGAHNWHRRRWVPSPHPLRTRGGRSCSPARLRWRRTNGRTKN